MRCFIIFDDDNYIMSIKSASDGPYSLPADLDLNYLNCYYLSEDKFLLDENKKKKVIEENSNQSEIEDLKKKLNETDYIFAHELEEITALNNPLTFVTDLIAILVRYSIKYKETIANRIKWRKRIEELGG